MNDTTRFLEVVRYTAVRLAGLNDLYAGYVSVLLKNWVESGDFGFNATRREAEESPHYNATVFNKAERFAGLFISQLNLTPDVPWFHLLSPSCPRGRQP